MPTRQPPSPAVEPKNGTVRRTSSTRMTVQQLAVFSLSVRSSTSRSPCACAAMRRATGWSRATASDVALLHGRHRGIGMGEHEARHAIGERRLADAALAADQPGMRHAAAAIGVEQRLLGLGDGRTARWSRADAGSRHRRRASAACALKAGFVLELDRRALAGSSFFCTTRQICVGDLILRVVASISTQRSGSSRRERQEAVAQLFVERQRLALEAVGAAVAAPLVGARASPSLAGTSRMKVRSGLVSPTMMRSSAGSAADRRRPRTP